MLPNSGRCPAARRLRAANIVTGMHSSKRARGSQTRHALSSFPTYHLRHLSSPSSSFSMIPFRGGLCCGVVPGLVVIILAANCIAAPAHLSTSESSLAQPLERRARSGISGAAVAGITVGGVLLLAVVFIIVRGCVQRRCVNFYLALPGDLRLTRKTCTVCLAGTVRLLPAVLDARVTVIAVIAMVCVMGTQKTAALAVSASSQNKEYSSSARGANKQPIG